MVESVTGKFTQLVPSGVFKHGGLLGKAHCQRLRPKPVAMFDDN